MKHISKYLLAGFATIIPLAVFIFFISYLEKLFSGLGIQNLSFYFPGLGILLALIFMYLVGLTTSTIVGKVVLKKIDHLAHKTPLLGNIYKTLKETLGYSNGKNEIFQESVWVNDEGNSLKEIGFVTNHFTENKRKMVTVFVPNTPNPSSGRLVFIEESKIQKTDKDTRETFKTLMSVGKK